MDMKTIISRIAWLYHINNNTQQEIADKFNMSRIKVVRYLQQAKEMGIVKVTVSLDRGYCFEEEESLRKLLNIDIVTVAPSADSKERAVYNIGIAGSMRMNQLLSADDILGVSWGTTLYNVAKHIEPVKHNKGKQIQVVQLMGAFSSGNEINPDAVAKIVVNNLDGHGYWLNMPAIVDSIKVREFLMNESSVKTTFEKVNECSICMLGIGNISENSFLHSAGAHSKEDLKILNQAGAVGDILSWPYDINGLPIKLSLSDRVIAASLEQIKKIKKRVAIAVGEEKVKSIVGACCGGYINELITDENTAHLILDFFKSN